MVQSPLLTILNERCAKGLKSLMWLIDPDKFEEATFIETFQKLPIGSIQAILVGGSLISGDNYSETIAFIKSHVKLPVILFPNSSLHLDYQADGILFISLISGRNADLLIGQHILVAPMLKRSKLEILPTGYMLIEGGKQTTVSYISNTTPIPADKPEIAACTAMAGELLGLQLIYADAGSGATKPISPKMISLIKKSIDIPLIVGGGIKSVETAQIAYEAGADILVIGNAIEEQPDFLLQLVEKMGYRC
jgi:phosphoglycerol geranylgeranyltransferase